MDTTFTDAAFSGFTSFRGAAFSHDAWFFRAVFSAEAHFPGAAFSGNAWFSQVTFSGAAEFKEAVFCGEVRFEEAVFSGEVRFEGATLTGNARFDEARFETAAQVGPLACGGKVELGSAEFAAPVTVEIAAREVSFRRTRWRSTATLRLRRAAVDLSGAVLEYPMTLSAEPAPFRPFTEDTEQDLFGTVPGVQDQDQDRGRGPDVRVAAVGGVDTALLALTDVDLSGCRFAGAVHLDQIRIDGRSAFARPPAGWRHRGPLPLRWSRRRVLAEEHHWRAAAARRPAPGHRPSAGDWRPGPDHPDLQRTPGPETAAALYRQLRKALEDGKNEPGAADFYYGECEMRRHDRTGTPWVERALLAAYWAVSGYGLRASRALAWLGVTMTATLTVMMLWGLPSDAPRSEITGEQTGRRIELTSDTPDPASPTGPVGERLTSDRFEKGLRVVINSVIFRTSGQELTTTGTYTEMASRFAEPVFLSLAVLAIRARVKR